MHKKLFLIFFSITFLIFLNVSTKKMDTYKKWIQEEVNPIITKAEKSMSKK